MSVNLACSVIFQLFCLLVNDPPPIIIIMIKGDIETKCKRIYTFISLFFGNSSWFRFTLGYQIFFTFTQTDLYFFCLTSGLVRVWVKVEIIIGNFSFRMDHTTLLSVTCEEEINVLCNLLLFNCF